MKNKRIIAVVPARAGSKGIPNKNIRLLNGKPLVSYAIANSLASKYISETIVTTDSPMVKIIAREMGAKIIDRSSNLCSDESTLDSVIYDASRRFNCDVVITLQPTSPTLRTQTLDAAIDFFLNKNLDTLISVKNDPHLAWTRNTLTHQVSPLYEKRLNRQYLPAHYAETGAFVISRCDVVSPHSRFGKSIDVYELPDAESIDIDTYIDLAAASIVLADKRVAFYVNGNNKRGLGHIYRALELADEFYTKPDIYYDINQTDRAVFGETTHTLLPVNGIGELLSAIAQKQYSIFINDILDTSLDYMIAIRTALPNAKIINFEDNGEGASRADIVFNALFGNSESSNVLAGESYYIASRPFMFYHPRPLKDHITDIFVSFGGADPQNYSERLLTIASKEKYRTINFHFVLGRAKTNVTSMIEAGAKIPNIEILHDIVDMPSVMSKCDIGITSRGRTGYELALLGIPSIAMAQNHREEKHGFVCQENGFSYLGLNPTDMLIESTLDAYISMPLSDRERYRKLLLSHDLRNGRTRVMNLINAL